MKISVVGAGYVGTVLAASLAKEGYDIILIDVDSRKVEKINNYREAPFFERGLNELLQKFVPSKIRATTDLRDAIFKTDFTFICVGTPSRKEGYIHLEQIKDVCLEIALAIKKKEQKHYIVIKSTVLPGTSEECIKIIEDASGKKFPRDFSLAANPEFLREGNALQDFQNQDRIVIGSADEDVVEKLKELYATYNSPYLITNFKEAEMIKYANNAFLATKISFVNEIGNICKKMGIDTNVVAKGIGMDWRIGPHFLISGIGFGGSCFPKDVTAIIYKATEKGYNPKILRAVLEVNKEQPHKIIELLDNKNSSLKEKKIAILGLAFKAETDDVRESPSLQIIKELMLEQSELFVYDPVAIEHVKKIFPTLSFTKTAQEAVDSADIVLLLTEWEEFTNINYGDKYVLDAKNVFSLEKAYLRPINYEGVCW